MPSELLIEHFVQIACISGKTIQREVEEVAVAKDETVESTEG